MSDIKEIDYENKRGEWLIEPISPNIYWVFRWNEEEGAYVEGGNTFRTINEAREAIERTELGEANKKEIEDNRTKWLAEQDIIYVD